MLNVFISSFSYRRGIPADDSGHGGGFVFDCRAIHNPGRYEQYARLTGKDREVKDFFANEPEMTEFLSHTFALVDPSIRRYLERDFTSLTVNYGCTGGQHRSVFAAEALSKHIAEFFSTSNVNAILRHTELEFYFGSEPVHRDRIQEQL